MFHTYEKGLYKYFKAPLALLCGFPERSLTALNSPKIEKEMKLCYKCFTSRINNVPLKNSLYNCYLIFPYVMGVRGMGGGKGIL